MRRVTILIQIVIGLILLPGLSMGDQGREMLPREFREIELLTNLREVKKKLQEAGLTYREDGSEPLFPDTSLRVTSPPGLQWLNYSFYERKLAQITVDYNMKDSGIDFEVYFSDLKQKYGEPMEKEERNVNRSGDKDFFYRWKDDRTILEVHHVPPGKDLSGRAHSGLVRWSIIDRELKERSEKSIQEKLNLLDKLRSPFKN